MKDDEKTEHLPAHKATLMRPSPHATPASPPTPPAKDDEQTVMRAPTEMAAPTAVDPDATKKTMRPEVPATAARTLQAAPPTAQSAYAKTLPTPGPGAAYAPTLQAQSGPLTGPDGTQVLSNRLVGYMEIGRASCRERV